MKPVATKPVTMKPDIAVEFDCPFCGKWARMDSSDGSAAHAMPPCSKFEELNPLEFIKAVNDEIGRQRGVGIS